VAPAVDHNGIPLGDDGLPLWDVKEWGTRGPPWRRTLVSPEEARSATSGPFHALEASLAVRPPAAVPGDARGAVDRMAQRMVDHSRRPGGSTLEGGRSLTHEEARKYVIEGSAKRHDRRNGTG
jgi:hypothetical protein